jgi:hypothetical protein
MVQTKRSFASKDEAINVGAAIKKYAVVVVTVVDTKDGANDRSVRESYCTS